MKVHFLDVGQADSILIELPNGENMLIDAGNSGDGSSIVSYIKKQGIQKLDYCIATHPHADHIGGMATVINSLVIDRFIMPDESHTTATFEEMVDALLASNLSIVKAKSGVSLLDTDDLAIEILGPRKTTGDLNNSSAIVRITYGSTSFLFIGDAESKALAGLPAMKVDVLKVGHHGSDTSSPKSFLKKMNPKHGIISVGKGNSYGHPTKSTLTNLKNTGAKVYRTDEAGTIIVTSDGVDISVNKTASAITDSKPKSKPPATTKPKKTKPESTKPKATTPVKDTSAKNKGTTVYRTKTGKKYHKDGCRSLSKSKIEITLEEAKSRNLQPCKICH